MSLRGIVILLAATILATGASAADGELHTRTYCYEGGVDRGEQHGYGVCRYSNGNTYYGFWNHGYKEGLGRMVFADGTVEFGNWVRGRLSKPKGQKFVQGIRCYGIDVAKYQKKVDWSKLALKASADGRVSAGGKGKYLQPVLFALIKSTEGTTIVDPYFKTNFREAKRCGIVRGAYHFLSVYSPVEEQVKYYIANTPLEPGDLPPILDLEIDKKVMAKEHDKVVRMAKQWLAAIEKHYGVKPIIYTYNNYYIDYLKGHGLDGYDYWIARYGAEPSARHWEIWQQTDKGRAAGIDHAVDIDLFRGNFPEFMKYVKAKGIKKLPAAKKR